MRRLVIILLLLVAACAPQLSIPTGDCYGFTGDEQVVSANHCLQPPYTIDTSNPIIQAVPDGWQLTNELVNADGVRDKYTDRARITSNGFGLTFELHNGLFGIDGRWGYMQDVTLTPGCYLLKVSGHGYINDPPNQTNYAISGYFDEALISQQLLPLQSGFELIYPFSIVDENTYPIRWMVDALWGSAGHGSQVDILSAGVLSVDSGYCDG
ncbi:MAG TPA: hypothetical protein ENI05_03820 [Porticoccus sp.]|nr:hypothetical protein [Porticoccus sp.]